MTCEFYLKLLRRKLAANCLKNNPPVERWVWVAYAWVWVYLRLLWVRLKWPYITSEAPLFSNFHLVLPRHWFLKHSLSESNRHAACGHIERPQVIAKTSRWLSQLSSAFSHPRPGARRVSEGASRLFLSPATESPPGEASDILEQGQTFPPLLLFSH